MGFEDVDLLDMDVHTYDPEPMYEWLREEAPLFWDKHSELWAVSRYEDVVFVSRNTEIFCSGQGAVPNITLEDWPDEAMINKDGRAHTCQRALVSTGFTMRNIRKLEGYATEVVTELIDSVAQRGECDLVMDIARPLPMRLMGLMLGYPREREDDVLDWTDVYVRGGCGPSQLGEDLIEAFANFVEFHEELIEQRKKQRGDDLLSIWLDAEIDGEKLSDDKLMFEHNLVLVGGSESTRHAISLGLLELFDHPEQRQYLLDHPEAIPNAVEEMIRWSTPFIRMRRTLTTDYEMHGTTMREGDQIIMLYPAANRDPRIWDRPQEFDIHRSFKKPALSFGYGKHFCLGAALARLETRILVEQLLQRLPDMHLTPGASVTRRPSCFLRGLSAMPVTFTPEPA